MSWIAADIDGRAFAFRQGPLFYPECLAYIADSPDEQDAVRLPKKLAVALGIKPGECYELVLRSTCKAATECRTD